MCKRRHEEKCDGESYQDEILLQNIEDAATEVFRELGGPGYTEHVYQNALRVELELQGWAVGSEVPVSVVYKSRHVGVGRIDLLVENRVVVEVKTIARLNLAAEKQTRAYLRAMGLIMGICVNFGVTGVEVKRVSGVIT